MEIYLRGVVATLFIFPVFLLFWLLKNTGQAVKRIVDISKDQLIFLWFCGVLPGFFWKYLVGLTAQPYIGYIVYSWMVALLFLIPISWKWIGNQNNN